ncbi:nitrate reductase gamma subunit [Thermodesulfitimonas autotrophica]|uniref:Nitrate reductase gamma subunit n=1 Tax=Thermodesulfitimonas autotrophica TaxID=1894989 RepID=A0A3N5AD95_9THEO|nr:respiratory nitrate reductase subunit gamma [Thermodesulfitimonas autotrophica]RPF42523.1 nitrate reductase gamma subunit [Thermodesulfitimonas autotrophica]
MGSFAAYLAWLAVAVFVFMVIYRFIKFNSMPLHLRWELYPLPLEPKHHHGGSYMEEVDYVRKPRHHIRINGILDMASEVFLLKKVKEYNKYGMWPFSFCMHWGIYLMCFWAVLLVVEEVFNWGAISPLSNVVGAVAIIAGAFGSLGLILKRVGIAELAAYTAPVDYFNLFFLLAIFATGIIAWVTDPYFFDDARAYVAGAVTLQPVTVPFWVALQFLIFELFLLYMPFSKLFHYVAKYFTIDKVLWDDILNVKGSAVDKKITSQLSYKLTWAGPHIVPGKTWVEEVEIVDAREGK